MSQDKIQEIEQSIRRAKKTVELGDALDRLKNNRDFKQVIIEGYFEREAIRLVHLKADQNMQKPEHQASIVLQMDAIGGLSSFFNTVMRTAEIARKSIGSDEEARDEILVEELNNG